MTLGDIYQAPWGRYVLHCLVPLVLRSLDTPNAAIMPSDGVIDPAYVATGERLKPVTLSPQTGRSESVSPHVASQVPLSASAGTPPMPALVDTRCEGPFGFPPIARPAPLTLGGMRPGTGLCIIPGRPTLWWRPCLSRQTYGGWEHLWFLAPSNDQSLFCHECRKTRPWVVVVKKGVEYTEAELNDRKFASSPAALVELSASPAPSPEFSGGGVLPATPPREDVGGFTAPRPAYKPATPAAWREELTERAAIMEYLGGMPRPTAEQMARALVGPEPRKAA